MKSVEVILNGERRSVPEKLSVADLLRHLNIPADRVAVERNLEVLARAAWDTVQIQAGDELEIVHFVGGG